MNKNKFYIMVAEWCPYCRQAKDAIFQLMNNYFNKGNIDLLEEGTEEYRKFATQFQQFGLPTFIVIDENNKQVDNWQGDRSYASLLKFYIKNTDTEILKEDEWIFSDNLGETING